MKSTLLFACLLIAALPGSGGAQGARSLFWDRMDVHARLDAEGRLHVKERQAIVFDGAWNGGERRFDIRRGQRLELHGITRIDADGAARRLTRGDLAAVDHYDWANGSTVRWRSRLPDDPPFQNTEIIYELDYTLTGVLLPVDGGGYRLAHDFTFPDRSAVIRRFTLDFDAADAWQTAAPLPLRLERENIAPGASAVVTLALQYTGAGRPSGVPRVITLTTPIRAALLLVLLAGLFVLARNFARDENARGRFDPLHPPNRIDAAWLDEHVFSMPPEVAGTLWDNSTSSSEVAAMIARLVMEGKLASRVETVKKKEVLHLERKVPLADLTEDERRLVSKLFLHDETTTDTERIKKRYKKTGFDPAALINPAIEKRIKQMLPSRKRPASAARALAMVAVVLALIGAAAAAIYSAGESPLVVAPVAMIVIGVIALVVGAVYRGSVVNTMGLARWLLIMLAAAAVPALAVLLKLAGAQAAAMLGVALVVLHLCFTYIVLRIARTSEDAQRLEARRRVAAARAFFIHQLEQRKPAIQDAWYPYLLAFGLGDNVDQWFKAFGGSTSSMGQMTTAAAAGGSWSGGGPAFGGGGGFGGGGAGRSWTSAVTALSAGVASPGSDSSSGGGGGGGGGSSGGGGGGGW